MVIFGDNFMVIWGHLGPNIESVRAISLRKQLQRQGMQWESWKTEMIKISMTTQWKEKTLVLVGWFLLGMKIYPVRCGLFHNYEGSYYPTSIMECSSCVMFLLLICLPLIFLLIVCKPWINPVEKGNPFYKKHPLGQCGHRSCHLTIFDQTSNILQVFRNCCGGRRSQGMGEWWIRGFGECLEDHPT